MEKIREILGTQLLAPNSIGDWCLMGGIILFGLLFRFLFARVFTRIIFRFFRRRDSQAPGYDKMFELLRKPWGTFIILLSIYIACLQLSFPPEWKMTPPDKMGIRMILERSYSIVLICSFTWIILRLTDFFGLLLQYRASLTEDRSDDQLVPFFKESIKVVIVILCVFFILGSVFRLNVASLIAGLGIGGLAVALAAKDSLENLLASFTIFLDKPFVIGDQVTVGGNINGTVERIGFRSTRLRTEEKSFITVPNRKMVETEVNNLSLRPRRRVRQVLGLTYDTPPEKFKAIIAELQELLDKDENVDETESRVKLFEFSPSSIDILVIYYIKELDYDVFLNVKQDINFRILDIVTKHGASFAFPSTSVYLEKK